MIISFLKRYKILILSLIIFFLWSVFSFVHAESWAVSKMEDVVRYFIDLEYNFLAWILSFFARLMDNFLVISFSPAFLDQPFIRVAWSNMRDIANMTFIIGAIWIAYEVMRDNSEEWKKHLIKLIMVAVVLNFSFFFSRVIIDAGNLAGRAMYNSIAVDIQDDKNYLGVADTLLSGMSDGKFSLPEKQKSKSLTAAFMVYLQPQVLTQNPNILESEDSSLTLYMATMLLLSFVYVLFAINFFSVSFMMITRLLWLGILTIVSPLAFITLFLPLGKVLEGKNFNTWLSMLFQRSFCITLYLFWIWLAFLFMQIDFGFGSLQSGWTGHMVGEPSFKDYNFFAIISAFVLKLVIVGFLISKSKTSAKNFCEGNTGGVGGALAAGAKSGWNALKTTKRFAGKMGGTALKRRMLGGFGSRLANSKLTNKWIARETGFRAFVGHKLSNTGQKIEEKSGWKEHSAKRRKQAIETEQRMERNHPELYSQLLANKEKRNVTFGENMKGKHIAGFSSTVNQKEFDERMKKVDKIVGSDLSEDEKINKVLEVNGGFGGKTFTKEIVKARKGDRRSLMLDHFKTEKDLGVKDVILSSKGVRAMQGSFLSRMLTPELADARVANMQLENVKESLKKDKKALKENIEEKQEEQIEKTQRLDQEYHQVASSAANVVENIVDHALVNGNQGLPGEMQGELINGYGATKTQADNVDHLVQKLGNIDKTPEMADARRVAERKLKNAISDITKTKVEKIKNEVEVDKKILEKTTQNEIESIKREQEKLVKDADGQVAIINKGFGGSDVLTKEDVSEVN